MGTLKAMLRSRVATAVLFAAAAALLVGGGVGVAAAAPNLVSGDFRAEVELASMQVAVVENGNAVEGDALLAGLVPEGEAFRVGARYDEQLSVRNTGDADAYVRMTLTRWWADGQGKDVQLDPGLIGLELAEGAGWMLDESASTPERLVLYYGEPLAPGAQTPPCVTGLAVDGAVVTQVTRLADGTPGFDYEGVQLRLRAVADAVQTHNGDAAMTATWGRTLQEVG